MSPAEQEELLERVRVLERELANTRLEALTDPLTGCLNRRGWERALEAEHTRCVRHGLGAVVAAIDLDQFKSINDQFGHHAGDEMLRNCSIALRGAVREHDIVARPGGDEFAVLSVQTRSDSEEAIAQRLDVALTAADIEASLGVASLTGAPDLASVWHEADRRMLAGKRAARRSDGLSGA